MSPTPFPGVYAHIVIHNWRQAQHRGRDLQPGQVEHSVPEGRSENSTALQCRGPFVDALTSPGGTTEMSSQPQSSLRDSRRSLPDCPGTEVPGYYHCVPTGTPRAPISESNRVILLHFTWSVRACV